MRLSVLIGIALMPVIATSAPRPGDNLVRNPGFEAFGLLQRMRGTRVAATCSTDPVDALACRSPDGKRLWVLLWNLVEKPDGPAYTTDVRVDVTGFAGGTAVCYHRSIGPGHGDPFSLWQKLGSPPQLSGPQVRQLQAEASLRPSEVSTVSTLGGKATLSLKVEGYSLHLLELVARS
jgi:hypothetical protein